MSLRSLFRLSLSLGLVLPPGAFAQNGSIKGKVTFEGEKPTPVVLEMATEAVCKAHHAGTIYSEKTVVGEGNTVQWAFVHIGALPAGATAPAPGAPAVIDQQGCQYSPHVVGVQVDQELQIKNSDPVFHNVRSEPKANTMFNLVMPMQNMVIPQKFPTPEMGISMKCDVHPWMQSYVHVLSHPYFSVSDATGAFEIKDVPPGDYDLAVWHEAFSGAPQKVTVKAGEAAEANFVVKAGAAPDAAPASPAPGQ